MTATCTRCHDSNNPGDGGGGDGGDDSNNPGDGGGGDGGDDD